MPNRIIRDRILSSDSLARLSHPAERLFFRMIVLVDDFGRFHGSPQYVRHAAMPMLDVSIADVGRWLHELADVNIACLYDVDGRHYFQFKLWTRYQSLRAKTSKFPAHSMCICAQVQADARKCEQMSPGYGIGDGDGVGEKKDTSHSAGDVRVAPGRRLERTKLSARAAALYAAWSLNVRQRFERFWVAYAHKVARAAAIIAWDQIGPPADPLADTIIDAASSQRREWNRKQVPLEKTPHAASWLNAGRWEDEIPTAAQIAARDDRVVL